MSLLEQISETAKNLPEPSQAEAMRYVEYLHHRAHAAQEDMDWARLSAEQLATTYAPGDEIYDGDDSSFSLCSR